MTRKSEQRRWVGQSLEVQPVQKRPLRGGQDPGGQEQAIEEDLGWERRRRRREKGKEAARREEKGKGKDLIYRTRPEPGGREKRQRQPGGRREEPARAPTQPAREERPEGRSRRERRGRVRLRREPEGEG